YAVGGHVLGHYRARPDDRVVADRHPAQDARAVADPDAVAHANVALVDALEPDAPVDLHHPVIEVDQHHAVGDHALAPDRHVLVRGDRALLAEHGLRADRDDALVAADLRSVAEPRPAAELDPPSLADLERDLRPDECDAVGPQAPTTGRREESAPQQAEEQTRVLRGEHAVREHGAK